jgi:osmotically-inducible protein OsmY
LQINPKTRGPKEQFADVALGAKVAANIAAQAGVNAARVKPEVHGGVVTLSGTVPSMSIKATILEAVRKTSGVEVVNDRIEVKP